MKKRRSALALTALVFGSISFCFFITHNPGGFVLGFLFGLLTLCFAIPAIITISRRPNEVRGLGLAAAGTCLGSLAIVLSFISFTGVVNSNRSRNHDRHRHDQTMQRVEHAAATFRDTSASDFDSNLPIVVLDMGSNGTRRHPDGTLVQAKFIDTKNGRAKMSAKPDHQGLATFRPRGHSTRNLPKRSYTMHTMDASTNQAKVSLLGLPAEEDWVLYAPFEDKSMIRDVLAYELARRMGHYAPRTRYVELFITRGEGKVSMRDYYGVYVLVERIKRGKQRVNIEKLGPEDNSEPAISGGYIVKRDHHDDDGARFNSNNGGPYFYVYPRAENITAEQKRYIRGYINKFENALYGDDFADAKKGYDAYLDVDTFIDFHWLIELSKNVDGFRYSTFLTKDRGEKLKPGPPWDWNRAFGNANYYGGNSTKGWYWGVLRPNEISWHHRLREDSAYVRKSAARWQELRKDVFDPKNISKLIDEKAAELEEAQKRNFERWPILGEHVSSNSYVGNSYREEVQWLKKWVEGRIAWIDKQVVDGGRL
ncbi:MAG TPA: CotH kinase family protein [Verrucomicrobiae bacterium]